MPSTLITGSNRGIGLELVRQYAAAGWRVLASCRNPDAASELRELASGRQTVSLHALDVSDGESVERLARDLDGQPIDVLVNNAGVIGPRNQSFGTNDYDGWIDAFRINTLGAMRMCEAFVENVARSEKKLIIAVTSGMGSIGDSGGGSYAYRSSKAALNMVIHNVALDLRARGIIACVINPGWVQTDMGGPGAGISVEESVSKMRDIFDRLTPEDTGKFLNYRGGTYEW